jgi:hypothetical protein
MASYMFRMEAELLSTVVHLVAVVKVGWGLWLGGVLRVGLCSADTFAAAVPAAADCHCVGAAASASGLHSALKVFRVWQRGVPTLWCHKLKDSRAAYSTVCGGLTHVVRGVGGWVRMLAGLTWRVSVRLGKLQCLPCLAGCHSSWHCLPEWTLLSSQHSGRPCGITLDIVLCRAITS